MALCYLDKTFCNSDVETHTCGRELSEHDKEQAERIGLPIAYGYFCNNKQSMNTQEILEERGGTHGDFTFNAALSQQLKDVIRDDCEDLTDVQKEALDMILHKISRIVAGNPNYSDHWEDIAGYAQLVVERLEK